MKEFRKAAMEKYLDLVAEGSSKTAAAKACGVAYMTITRWLRLAGMLSFEKADDSERIWDRRIRRCLAVCHEN